MDPLRAAAVVLFPAFLLSPSPASDPGPGAAAPSTPTQESGSPPRCTSPEHRAFDFWIGRWEVRRPDGALAGHNTIRRTLDGCVLHERYTTPEGYAGESFNVYDRSRDVWHQTWVDRAGQLLVLEGGFRDGAMVLEGETVQPDGSRQRQRITWTRIDGDPNRVRQHWEVSSDGGRSWETAFDGRYHRMR